MGVVHDRWKLIAEDLQVGVVHQTRCFEAHCKVQEVAGQVNPDLYMCENCDLQFCLAHSGITDSDVSP